MKLVKQMHMTPAKKNGLAVPVVISIEIRYKRDENGQIVLGPPKASGTHNTD